MMPCCRSLTKPRAPASHPQSADKRLVGDKSQLGFFNDFPFLVILIIKASFLSHSVKFPNQEITWWKLYCQNVFELFYYI